MAPVSYLCPRGADPVFDGGNLVRGVTLGRRGLLAGLVLLAAMALVVPVALAATKTINVTSSSFPAKTTIRVGDTVRWVNSSNVMHDVTANDGSFESGYFDDGESYSVKFTAAGSYPYHCTLHSGMTGRIVVQSASSGGGGGGSVPVAPATDTATGASGAQDQPDFLAALLALLGVVMLAVTLIIDRPTALVRVESDEHEDR